MTEFQEETLWLNGTGQQAVIKLSRQKGCDFVLDSLVLCGAEYKLEDSDGFSQWVYLVSPAAYRMALSGTRWSGQDVRYLCRSHATLSADSSLLHWSITVNYLVSTCGASGIGMVKKDFDIVLVKPRPKIQTQSSGGCCCLSSRIRLSTSTAGS